MRFIDTHCHLNFAPLSRDVQDVMERACARHVTDIILPAYDSASWDDIDNIGKLKGIHPAFGLHPWVADAPLNISNLRKHLVENNAVAIGEIGLDFKVDISKSRQMDVFGLQLELAEDLDLPVILHCRNAFEEMFRILSKRSPVSGVVHAFSRGPEIAKRFLDLGLHIAFGGAVTRTEAHRLQRAARVIAPDRLLIETDAPSIGIEGIPPEGVEPAHVAQIAAALAVVRNEPLEEISAVTTRNAIRLFRIC